MTTCSNCKTTTAVGYHEHHIKYREIHGVDETTFLCSSCHRALHIRLRRQGKCNIPSKELKKITQRAVHRTEACKKNARKYYKENIKTISLSQNVGDGVSILTDIRENKVSKNIGIYHNISFNRRK